jgi:hypothetical protein
LLLSIPSTALAQQSLNLYLGGFAPRGEDSRVDGDVLVNNLSFFDFDIEGFDTFTFGGEWLVALGRVSEVGIGIGYSSDEEASRYSDLVNDQNGENIRQDLKLRIIPIWATYRFLPLGRNTAVQPYIGGGAGILVYRYTETGEFVDFSGNIFRDRFEASGASAGPVILGGLRVSLGAWDVGGEVRWQKGEGDVDPDDFAGATKVDLGGFNYLVTFNIRF